MFLNIGKHVRCASFFCGCFATSFCELCLSSRTNKHSSFLYPKYSHTTNLDLYLDVG